jgi:hypothetical protein
LRKSFLVAGVATLALGSAGIAYAQNPAPTIDVTASVSPTKAGTKSKPKSEKFKLQVVNNAASKTTAASIEVTFPSTLKVSTSGLTQCTASDTELIANINVCKSSIAGTGSARALLNPNATSPAPLNFKVVPVVGKNELLFVLSGAADAVLHGPIKGRKMTIRIPDGSRPGEPNLQQPVPGAYSALNDLTTTISKKKGSKALITSTGCKSKKHTIGVKVRYAPNPAPPAASSASNSSDAKCS